jgi:ABC-type uncharacterized transport system substrate-binding protein
MPNKLYQIIVVGVVLLVLCGLLTACGSSTPIPESDQSSNAPSAYEGKKILWVDSYHKEYEWSASIETGIRNVLNDTGIELKIVRMDTKRNTDDELRKNAATQAKAEIESFNPDVVIASDDNVQKYLVVPYLKDTSLPVVFCAVNWDALPYGYPASNVTGMLEVELTIQLIEHLQQYAQGDRLGYLSGDTDTDRKVVQICNERFFAGAMEPYFVETFDEYKATFLELQEKVDILYLRNNAGIEGWDDEEAESFIGDNTKIPTGSSSDWMAPYVLITLAKSGVEQGEWAAQAALRILDGTPVSEIPVAENKEGDLILNLNLVEQLKVVFAPSLLKNAEIYGGE